jgi:hypothetical protein
MVPKRILINSSTWTEGIKKTTLDAQPDDRSGYWKYEWKVILLLIIVCCFNFYFFKFKITLKSHQLIHVLALLVHLQAIVHFLKTVTSHFVLSQYISMLLYITVHIKMSENKTLHSALFSFCSVTVYTLLMYVLSSWVSSREGGQPFQVRRAFPVTMWTSPLFFK